MSEDGAGGPSQGPGAADLLRSVGLLADGPVLWGAPVRSSAAGLYVVELPAPVATAPIDLAAVRAWLERLPDLRLDGAHPTPAELAARLASFWLPRQVVLYVGSTARSIGGRVAAYVHTPLGDRRPHAAGQWLKTLRGLEKLRVWWAETEMAEEYEDALLDAFVEGVDAKERAQLPPGAPLLPFAVSSRSTGERRATGITGSLVPEEPPAPATHVRVLEPGPEERLPEPIRAARASCFSPAWSSAAPNRGRPSAPPQPPRRRTAKAAAAIGAPAVAAGGGAGSSPPPAEPVYMSQAGIDQLRTELDELITVRRPAILARIVAARELGDLRENGDYEAARKEQSFSEGRIQTIESLLRQAVAIDDSQLSHHVVMGSTVVVESHHGTETFTIVGSAEADAHEGRISYSSPIGRALMGHAAGDAVTIKVPAGAMDFRILEVR